MSDKFEFILNVTIKILSAGPAGRKICEKMAAIVEDKNLQSPSSEAPAVQNYFLLSEQSAFGAARFSRGSRPGLFSNCPLLSTPLAVGADQGTKHSAQPAEKIHLDVAIRKETLHLIKVPDSNDTYLLDFVFDANADGTLSIFYLAEEISDASNKTLKFETSYPVLLHSTTEPRHNL
jgi:hypothetical protein